MDNVADSAHVCAFSLTSPQNTTLMAIAIKDVPVLIGEDADRFNKLVEEAKQMPVTQVSQKMIEAMKALAERSRKCAVRK